MFLVAENTDSPIFSIANATHTHYQLFKLYIQLQLYTWKETNGLGQILDLIFFFF